MIRLSTAEARSLRASRQPRSKYGAVPTVVDNIRFHSAAEARRYVELKLLWSANEITGRVELQPRFPLEVRASRDEPAIIIGEYVADFAYTTADGERIVEDVKGMASLPLAKWKQKHVLAQYGITVREIRYR